MEIAQPSVSSYECGEQGPPESRLRGKRQVGFHHERIAQQRQQAPRVPGRVEEIRILSTRMGRVGEPALHRRSRRGKHHERRPTDHETCEERPPHGVAADGRLPCRRQRDRQGEHHGQQQGQLQCDMPGRSQTTQAHMRQGVSQHERDLEEHHRGVPDGGRPAQRREQHLRHHGLELEEQERAEERCRRERHHHPAGIAGILRCFALEDVDRRHRWSIGRSGPRPNMFGEVRCRECPVRSFGITSLCPHRWTVNREERRTHVDRNIRHE